MSIMGAAVSGMSADSNWLSTISQNVANANTTGYKTAETDFSSLVDQASTSSYDAGGVTTNVRTMNTVQGAVVSASSVTDLAIQGNGFFVVQDAGGSTYLTRAGSFVPDASGNLVNAAGFYLMGYNVQNGPPNMSANSYSGMEKVNIDKAGEQAVPTTSGTLTANLPATASIVAGPNLPSTNAANTSYTEKTSLVAYNNLGGSQTVDLYMTKTGADTWEVAAYDQSAAASGGGFPYSSGPLATQALQFDPTSGKLTSGGSLSVPIPNGKSMNLDLSGMTQLASAYNVISANTNGNAPNNITGVTVGADGGLSFQFADGSTIPGYDIPLATVASPDNLTTRTGNVFVTNPNSGAPQIGIAGSGSLGSIKSSSLESSTADLATELTDMIQAQSGYVANSKVFQTGADILSVLNNLKP